MRFPVQHISVALDGARQVGTYACCNMSAVYMTDGVLIVSKTEVKVDALVGAGSFSITPDKIILLKNQSYRIHLTVLI